MTNNKKEIVGKLRIEDNDWKWRPSDMSVPYIEDTLSALDSLNPSLGMVFKKHMDFYDECKAFADDIKEFSVCIHKLSQKAKKDEIHGKYTEKYQ
jgi:hypothetical protein